ncbi:hypothetical protein F0L46_04685 [Salinarimonas soli]|uniref:Uncharacterized protein n=2 Tax=Salinarimonas soli TaxID=1638099 RepID=A0A5B2VSN5_9HYPH|nr:hypothetical protein F0L46_04685 [Salinarimonas soli]
MDAGWFWALLMSIPALIALMDGYGEEAIVATGIGALAIVGGLIAWPLGLAVALAGGATILWTLARRNARLDMERRHSAIIRTLKLRVGVSERPLPACLRRFAKPPSKVG